MQTMIGVIGGSGIAAIDGLEGVSRLRVDTPWGAASDELTLGRIAGVPVAFLPRHGPGHRLDPASVPYRANVAAMKRVGVTDVLALSACGSLREEMAPGDFVVLDQYIDRTASRDGSFFGAGCVAHVAFADPTCARLSGHVAAAAASAGVRVHRGGTCLVMEGPQFSTRAESRMYRGWGADVIGMTGLPEAKLAREAEMCWAAIAMVTDWDAWRTGERAVDAGEVIAVMGTNAAAARALVADLPARLPRDRAPCPQGCDHALDEAIVTDPAHRDPSLMERLRVVADRALKARIVKDRP